MQKSTLNLKHIVVLKWYMARWRPSFKEEYREKLEQFLEDNPEIPFDNPKQLMEHVTDEFVVKTVRTSKADKQLEKLKEEHS